VSVRLSSFTSLCVSACQVKENLSLPVANAEKVLEKGKTGGREGIDHQLIALLAKSPAPAGNASLASDWSTAKWRKFNRVAHEVVAMATDITTDGNRLSRHSNKKKFPLPQEASVHLSLPLKYVIFVAIIKQKNPAVASKTRYSLYSSCCSTYLSMSSKVNDFLSHLKSVCHFLLVTNSNLETMSNRFRDGQFRFKTHIFPTPSIQPQILKCSPCTASPKLCSRRASTQD